MSMINNNPAQTVCNIVDAVELLAAVKLEDLSLRGEMGMFNLLRDISEAARRLEQTYLPEGEE